MQDKLTGSSHMYVCHCSALNSKHLCLFVTGFILIGVFTAAPEQRRDGSLLQLVMDTAVRASTGN